jgi:FMN phosphatase YigB (HAD superfamily)
MSQKNNNFIRNSKLPKAVIFDTDNTLYAYDSVHKIATRAVEDKAIKVLGIERNDFILAFNEARKEVKERLGSVASSHSRLLYMQGAIEKLGLGTRILLTLDLEQTYWRTFLNNCRLFPNFLDFAHQLKSRGIIMANITDLTAQIQFRKLIYFGLDELFDYVVTSEEAGEDKPSKGPFEIAINKLQVEPDRIWMIGDDIMNDIYGASKMGMTTIQKVHKGVRIEKNGYCNPDFVFEHYNDIIRVIDHL